MSPSTTEVFTTRMRSASSMLSTVRPENTGVASASPRMAEKDADEIHPQDRVPEAKARACRRPRKARTGSARFPRRPTSASSTSRACLPAGQSTPYTPRAAIAQRRRGRRRRLCRRAEEHAVLRPVVEQMAARVPRRQTGGHHRGQRLTLGARRARGKTGDCPEETCCRPQAPRRPLGRCSRADA